MQLRELVLDNSLRELTVRGEPGYPIAMYDNDMDGFLNGSVPWHWHNEIEFAFVLQGALTVETEGHSGTLTEGMGVFLNSGVLHRMSRGPDGACRMVTVVFDPLLISGAETSLLHTIYILPLTRCQALPVIQLSPETAWQAEVISRLHEAFTVYSGAAFGRELVIRQLLTEVWYAILRENREQLEQRAQMRKDLRLKQMLAYLQEHFAQSLHLEQIGAAASVSARECTRCFRQMLGISPMTYLTQLRVRAAAAMLERTDEPVTEIGYAVGFGSPSYFGKVFRDHTGMSPREYRQARRLVYPPSGALAAGGTEETTA